MRNCKFLNNIVKKISYKFFYSKFIFFISFFSLIANCNIEIPVHLSTRDLHVILQNIGPATASRVLSSPYPLGGNEGLEIGLTRQDLDLSILSNLGNKTKIQNSNFSFPTLTLGKGLYYDLDVFISLIPFAQSSSLSHFSTQIRSKHWKSPHSPFIISSIWHAGYTTLQNAINFQNYGFDILGTFIFQKTCMYFGVGTLFSNGRFIGGAEGITASLQTETVTSTQAHRVLGLDYRINEYFIALQTDSYDKKFYSIKIGYRF